MSSLLAVVLPWSCVQGQEKIKIPRTNRSSFLITDGQFTKEEWEDASIVDMSKKKFGGLDEFDFSINYNAVFEQEISLASEQLEG